MGIYLISPEIITPDIIQDLEPILQTGLVDMFQIRMKNCAKADIAKTSKELKKICLDYNCPIIMNDNLDIALELELSGVHLGGNDISLDIARKSSPKNFIIGASCYDSKDLATNAVGCGANYVSFGAFFPSKTKNSIGKPGLDLLDWAKKSLKTTICAIGGVTDKNCHDLKIAGADLVCVISYVWNNPYGRKEAIIKLKRALHKN